jgi:hypothetical protein
MCQFNKLASDMKMGFGQHMPMTMKYTLNDDDDNDDMSDNEAADDNESFARIHLAPKITEDEE